MAGMSIDKLKQILRERQLPADVEPPIEAMRKSMEKLAFQAADDIETEAISVADRAAEWGPCAGQSGRAGPPLSARRGLCRRLDQYAPVAGRRNLPLCPSRGFARGLSSGAGRALSGCG